MGIDIVINIASLENANEQQLIMFIELAVEIRKNPKKTVFIKPEGAFSVSNHEIFKIGKKYRDAFFSILNEASMEKTSNDFFIEDHKKLINSAACAIAYNFDHMTISAGSLPLWRSDKIIGRFDFINSSNEIESIENAEINNIAEQPYVNNAFSVVPQVTLDEKVSSGKDYWERREKLHPEFIFCGDTEEQICKMSMTMLKRLYNQLKDFNSCEHKDSSSTVKQTPNLNRYYLFVLPDGTKEYFFKHIDLCKSGERIHFLLKDKKYYIGYIGKHLPTAKYK